VSPAPNLTVTQLTSVELDDQAIAEIADLLRPSALLGTGPAMAALLRMVALGPLLVARRPCGEYPEIVAIAGRISPAQGSTIVAIADLYETADLREQLSAKLAQISKPVSLFRLKGGASSVRASAGPSEAQHALRSLG
jgi:hypothetical protein